jgi:hypothetical protein
MPASEVSCSRRLLHWQHLRPPHRRATAPATPPRWTHARSLAMAEADKAGPPHPPPSACAAHAATRTATAEEQLCLPQPPFHSAPSPRRSPGDLAPDHRASTRRARPPALARFRSAPRWRFVGRGGYCPLASHALARRVVRPAATIGCRPAAAGAAVPRRTQPAAAPTAQLLATFSIPYSCMDSPLCSPLLRPVNLQRWSVGRS